MIPIDALGLACNVISLVQLGISVAKEAAKIYEGGTANSEHIDAAKRLESTYAALNHDLSKPVSARNSTPSEKALRELAEKCTSTTAELLKYIVTAPIVPGTKRWKALGISVKSKLKAGQIQRLHHTMETYRQTLDTTILVELRSVYTGGDHRIRTNRFLAQTGSLCHANEPKGRLCKHACRRAMSCHRSDGA